MSNIRQVKEVHLTRGVGLDIAATMILHVKEGWDIQHVENHKNSVWILMTRSYEVADQVNQMDFPTLTEARNESGAI